MPQDNPPSLVPQSISLSSENVFRQIMLYGTDNTDTSYYNQIQSDVAGVPVWDMAYANPSNVYKRKKSIPDTVVYNKYQSVDFKICLNQNRKGFGFIPYNDLMIYTGQEVVRGVSLILFRLMY